MEELISVCVPKSAANYQLPDPALLMYFQNLDDRILWLNEPVDENTIEFVQRIIAWNMEDVGLPINERIPVKVFINSLGGYLNECLAVVDTMLMSKTPIYTICVGMAASAASLIFLGGSKRYILPNAKLLFHQGSAQVGGNAADVISCTEDYKKQLENMKELILRRCGKLEKRKLNSKWKTDWYVDAAEAIEIGAADTIISDIDELMRGTK